MDTRTATDECSTCHLTPAAALLLAGRVRDLRQARGDDGSWRPTTCPDCGRVTGVGEGRGTSDDGDTVPGVEHEAPHAPAETDTTPEWVTPAEAAFVVGCPEQTILEWIESGRLERAALLGAEPPFILVRTIDVRFFVEFDGAATEPQLQVSLPESSKEPPAGTKRQS